MKMNKLIKLISTLLAVLMLASAATVVVSAAEDNEPEYTDKTGGKPSYDYMGKVLKSAEEKIGYMDFRYQNDKFELYVDAYSGEVAIRSKATGEVLFTNPYNLGKSTATSSAGNTKDEIMSQLVVHYTEVKTNMSGKLYSYTWAATRNQISVMNIKGGIRVEYVLGREESKSLLPRMIEAKAFQKIVDNISKNIEAAIEAGTVADPKNERYRLDKFKSWYTSFSLTEAEGDMYEQYCTDFPILKKAEEKAETDPAYENFTIYVLDTTIGDKDTKKQEALIKEYYKEYTFKNLEEDHKLVEYKAETETYPVFRMALEYTLEDSGLVVNLPANGIRFNEALYRLDNIEILPYMGAGMNPNEGYTFFPDGSGTIFDFQKIAILGTRQQVSGKVYGQDYAYHEVSGQYEEIIRYPVFGIYEKEQLTKTVKNENGEDVTVPYEKDRGYLAIVEEGDSLIELSSYHGGPTSEYNTIKLKVFPRPTDSYILADSISVGGSNEPITVVSKRKYTGNYKIRYIMLTDTDVAKEATEAGKKSEAYYEPSYVGMAKAYREYLYKNGLLKDIDPKMIEKDIPLYIETFGALETTEKFLSIPINVMTPLTTFADVQRIYKDLSGEKVGITNVNFILKGFTKGGMTRPSVPYNLKWENVVSKDMDFEELTDYAKKEGFGLFPDFDFVFSSSDTLFDGLNLDKHAVKTIDDRYSSKREYSATKHTYVSYYELALSPAYFSHFYEKFIPKFKKNNPIGISVSTLGSYLNSDFDEDEPYNRADGQKYTVMAFDYIDKNLKDTEIMTSGGNAYSWKYVDHITDIALDSSRFSIASASVPFLGIVLHGYVQIAGTPINMEGNIDYAILKSIESGAALKFILSYRNTDKLKEYETLSQYYSVNYDIWYNEGKGDLISIYKELNKVLADVQTSLIVGHEYVEGTRVPDNDELLIDAKQEIADAIEYETALRNASSEEERKSIYDARQLIIKAKETLKNLINKDSADNLYAKLEALKAIYNGTDGEYDKLIADAEKALDEYRAAQQFHAIFSKYVEKSEYTVEEAIKAYESGDSDAWNKAAEKLGADYAEKLADMLEAKKAYEDALKDAEAETDAVAAAELDTEVTTDTEDESADSDEAQTEVDELTALKKAYDDAVALLDVTPAGVAIDLEKAIDAMNKLAPVTEKFVAEYDKAEAGDKAKLESEYEKSIKSIYGELLDSGVIYEIKYAGKALEGSKYYGGSRYYRDAAKYKYEKAVTALDEKLKTLHETASAFKDAQVLAEMYTVENLEAALKLIKDNGAYSENERIRLEGIVEELKTVGDESAMADYDKAVKYDVDGAMHTAFGDGDYAVIGGRYEKLYEATDIAKNAVTSFDPIKNAKIEDMTGKFVNGKALSWTVADEEVVEEIATRPELNTDKYISDSNMIVLETFDNGKTLLLNFNDYRVVVELGTSVYTLDAYGYAVVKKATK